jgi:hypothetical protein
MRNKGVTKAFLIYVRTPFFFMEVPFLRKLRKHFPPLPSPQSLKKRYMPGGQVQGQVDRDRELGWSMQVVPGVLTPAECDAWLQAVLAVRAASEFGVHQTVFRVVHPGLSRHVETALDRAARRVRVGPTALLPPGSSVCDEWFYTVYPPGGGMGAHMDGAKRCSGSRSVASLLLYLTDDFEDGCTCFLDGYAATDAEADARTVAVVRPERGAALLLGQDVWHMARPARGCGGGGGGGLKVLLRSDVMVPFL